MRYLLLILALISVSRVFLPLQPVGRSLSSVKFLKKPNKTVVIGVIDTGLNIKADRPKINLCKYGHVDLSGDLPVPGVAPDSIGHGTNVAYIIDEFLRSKYSSNQYCLVIIKYYDSPKKTNMAVEKSIKSFEHATRLEVDAVNVSSSGSSFTFSEKEKDQVLRLLNKGVVISAAAGNSGITIGGEEKVYPAMYDDRIHIVGALDEEGKVAQFSNRGLDEMFWESGKNISAGGITLSGTSQATALHTARVAEIMIKDRF